MMFIWTQQRIHSSGMSTQHSNICKYIIFCMQYVLFFSSMSVPNATLFDSMIELSKNKDMKHFRIFGFQYIREYVMFETFLMAFWIEIVIK